MKNGSEWPLYEGIPIKKENIRPTVKVSKQVLDKNTLQPVMENWEKGSKQSSKTVGCI